MNRWLAVAVFVLALSVAGGCARKTARVEPGTPVVAAPEALEPAALPAWVEEQRDGVSYVRVYYATDRNYTGLSEQAKKYGTERSEVTYGECLVTIPALRHRVGGIERPALLQLELSENPQYHVILQNVQVLTKDEDLERIKNRVNTYKGKKAFVFVHGFNVTFEDAVQRTAQMAYDLKFAGAPILYSWPSDNYVSWQDVALDILAPIWSIKDRTINKLREGYRADELSIEASKENMKSFLKDVAERSNAESIYLIAHSMGSRAIVHVFEAMKGLPPQYSGKFKELILAAPDIDAKQFLAEIAPRITGRGARVTLYVSAKDWALEAARQVNGAPRAGYAGGDVVVHPGIDTIDVTSVAGDDVLGHSYYGGNWSVLHDIDNVLRAIPMPRFGMKPQGNYWRFGK